MEVISMIGLDVAKNAFQVHGADRTGHPDFRKELCRGRFLEYFVKLPPCMVATEACASARYWGHEISSKPFSLLLQPTLMQVTQVAHGKTYGSFQFREPHSR